jgi:hypothetical protein
LKKSLAVKKECPSHAANLTIEECRPFVICIERIAYHLQLQTIVKIVKDQKGSKTVETKPVVEVLKFHSEQKTAETTGATPGDPNPSEECAICLAKTWTPLYFVTADDNPDSIGRYLHEGCWKTTQKLSKNRKLISLLPSQMGRASEVLPQIPQPQPPDNSLRNSLLATVAVISFSCLIINRLSEERNPLLFAASIPALIVVKAFSFAVAFFQRTFLEARA